jgi:hypothetical protein
MGAYVIEYFKDMAEDTGIPHQSLINLYLRDCVVTGRQADLALQAADMLNFQPQ